MSTDLFSKQANLYAQFRPQYPKALYEFLVSLVAERELAWDCATGNGQAALDLSKYFKRVIATDISRNQIAQATAAPNIEYQTVSAEQSLALPDGSVDLVTVAQALHWFDLEKFYPEVKRLLKPRGVLATWAYSFHAPIQADIDRILNRFYFETLGPFWKPNNRLIWDQYRDLSFPFVEIQAPSLSLEVEWSLHDLIGYFRTWSATQLYREQNQYDPTSALQAELVPFWNDPESKKKLKWDLVVKVGRV